MRTKMSNISNDLDLKLQKLINSSKKTISLSNDIYLSFLELPINATQSKKIVELLNNIQNGSLLDINIIRDKIDKIIDITKQPEQIESEDFLYE